jgi:hypothetical protein
MMTNAFDRYAEKKKNLGYQAQILMETGKSLQTDLKDLNRANPTNRRYRAAKAREMNFRKVREDAGFSKL